MQRNIRYEEEKKGIDGGQPPAAEVARRQLPRCAGRRMRPWELGPTAFRYFQSRQERFRILQDERDEVGQYQNIPDYSELRRQWYSRDPITQPLPWPWDKMLALCIRFEGKGPSAWERLAKRKFDIVVASITFLLSVTAIVIPIVLN